MRLFPRTVPVGLRFGTVGVLDRHRQLHEVTTFRRDIETDGRHAVVQYGVSLEDDLARRDFTINALAYHPLRGEWQDPFDGKADLERGAWCARWAMRRSASVRTTCGSSGASASRHDLASVSTPPRGTPRAPPRMACHSCRRSGCAMNGSRACVPPASLGVLVRLWRDSGVAGVWMPELEPGDARAVHRPRRSVIPCSSPAFSPAIPVAVLQAAQGIQPGNRAGRRGARCASAPRAKRRGDGAAMAFTRRHRGRRSRDRSSAGAPVRCRPGPRSWIASGPGRCADA